MKRIALAMLLSVGLSGTAQAGELSEIQEKAVKITTVIVVGADWALHFAWNTLHNKIVHPAVSFLTLGTVDLDKPTDG